MNKVKKPATFEDDAADLAREERDAMRTAARDRHSAAKERDSSSHHHSSSSSSFSTFPKKMNIDSIIEDENAEKEKLEREAEEAVKRAKKRREISEKIVEMHAKTMAQMAVTNPTLPPNMPRKGGSRQFEL
jgi:hypothetical protein